MQEQSQKNVMIFRSFFSVSILIKDTYIFFMLFKNLPAFSPAFFLLF